MNENREKRKYKISTFNNYVRWHLKLLLLQQDGIIPTEALMLVSIYLKKNKNSDGTSPISKKYESQIDPRYTKVMFESYRNRRERKRP